MSTNIGVSWGSKSIVVVFVWGVRDWDMSILFSISGKVSFDGNILTTFERSNSLSIGSFNIVRFETGT